MTYRSLVLHDVARRYSINNNKQTKTNKQNRSLEAKHVNKKATKKHADRRPKKHMRSDIVRKPVEYPEVPSVPEYTISDAPASPAAKPV
mmetsp:Transcript_19258/g.38852  ORF Transcript_19258/g.38852 Transcript_19258/m.38852 type:complete len:89 (-) Transcript_19258:323-589(-)